MLDATSIGHSRQASTGWRGFVVSDRVAVFGVRFSVSDHAVFDFAGVGGFVTEASSWEGVPGPDLVVGEPG